MSGEIEILVLEPLPPLSTVRPCDRDLALDRWLVLVLRARSGETARRGHAYIRLERLLVRLGVIR